MLFDMFIVLVDSMSEPENVSRSARRLRRLQNGVLFLYDYNENCSSSFTCIEVDTQNTSLLLMFISNAIK